MARRDVMPTALLALGPFVAQASAADVEAVLARWASPALLAVVAYFVVRALHRLDVIASTVESVGKGIADLTSRVSGLERWQGRSEAKEEAREKECSACKTQIAVAARDVTRLQTETDFLRAKLYELRERDGEDGGHE